MELKVELVETKTERKQSREKAWAIYGTGAMRSPLRFLIWPAKLKEI